MRLVVKVIVGPLYAILLERTAATPNHTSQQAVNMGLAIGAAYKDLKPKPNGTFRNLTRATDTPTGHGRL